MAVSVTALYVLFAPRQYRSEAKLFVRIGRENVGLDATTTLGQSSPVTSLPMSREEEINTVVAILESRGLLEKVVDSIGAETVLDPITYPLRDPADPSKVTSRKVSPPRRKAAWRQSAFWRRSGASWNTWVSRARSARGRRPSISFAST